VLGQVVKIHLDLLIRIRGNYDVTILTDVKVRMSPTLDLIELGALLGRPWFVGGEAPGRGASRVRSFCSCVHWGAEVCIHSGHERQKYLSQEGDPPTRKPKPAPQALNGWHPLHCTCATSATEFGPV